MVPAFSYAKPARKLVAFLLTLAFLVPNSVERDALAVNSSAVNALSIATTVFAVTNTISSSADCVCMAAESTCPFFPWGTCMLLPLNLASLAASMMQQKKNKDATDRFAPGSGGGTLPGTNAAGAGGTIASNKPQPLDYGEFCSKTPDFCNDCAKNGDFSSCTPKLQLPDSFPIDAASKMPELADALGAINEAIDFVNENSDPALVGDSAAGDSGFADGSGGGSVDAVYVKKSKGPGKQDGDGLDRASIWGMDMVDEKSGAKLTLWQRATRRYYGTPDLKRLGFLARAEYVRAKAIEHAKANMKATGAQPQVAQQGTPAAAKAPAKAPASVSAVDHSAPVAQPVVAPKF